MVARPVALSEGVGRAAARNTATWKAGAGLQRPAGSETTPA
jgi:hypothetical protein